MRPPTITIMPSRNAMNVGPAVSRVALGVTLRIQTVSMRFALDSKRNSC